MKCPNCDNDLPEISVICDYCGSRFYKSNNNQTNDSKNTNNSSHVQHSYTEKTSYNDSKKTNSSRHVETSYSKKITYEDIKGDLPRYHYWLLIVSVFLSFFWFIPLIGLIASFIANDTIKELDKKYSEINLDQQYIYTWIAGGIHLLYIIVVLVRG